MKIQDELLTGIITDPQQLKKTGSVLQPETGFAALLAEELSQSQTPAQVAPGLKGINPLNGLAGIESLGGLLESTPSAGFSEQENQFMDELTDLLGVVDSYGMALAGQAGSDGQAQSGLKAVYNLLDSVSQKAQELKGMLSSIGDNPVLAGIVNELEVMAATEKFKFNRGDYLG